MNEEPTIRQIADETGLSLAAVRNAVRLLDDGNTLPFIARYRKEQTSGLDEIQLRSIQDALKNVRELAARKETVLRTIREQGKLTKDLETQIVNCSDRQQLEDLYLPYKPRRKTRAVVARERGLQPLADTLKAQRQLSEPATKLLQRFVSSEKDVPDVQAALAGARDIVSEEWSEEANLRRWMYERAQRGRITSTVKRGKKDTGKSFETYFRHTERVDRIPSHRFLAMKRGEAEGVLRLNIEVDEDYVLPRLRERLCTDPRFEFADQLRECVHDCYERLLLPHAESFLLKQLKATADQSAISVFANNVRQMLLAAPAGPHVTIGIDPGFRTGCKVAVVDETGRYVGGTTIFPTAPRLDTAGAAEALMKLIRQHHPALIAIGNGTASRETDAFVGQVIKDNDLQITKAIVSEAGASVYSASELAASEYPDLDLTVRGAISIAHRLQDPLAELVKIDPKAIGVGQYQHDVNQTQLQHALDREVESCVSSVGIDVNMASPSLLSYVPGIGPSLAKSIVHYREKNGAYRRRRDLLKVPKLGAKAFEQCAGFLRIRNGAEPLDNSAVHPESYAVVARLAEEASLPVESLVGNERALGDLAVESLVAEIGQFTVRDIIEELARPGRDPRSEFKTAQFAEGIDSISDLREGLNLEGVVTNVTHFGAFVDVGVHQDGLIHISQLADHFVNDPAQEVSVGDIVRVTVLEVDEAKKRISLSRKSRSAQSQ